ncbi:MAG: DUF4139 domain-containing protein [Cryomorphaceae bacterium]|nr:DUF4139 domain-containing protein [Cryomorphaceae bacterium]
MMYRILFFSMLSIGLFAQTNVPVKITKATLYPGAAEVTLEGNFNLVSGVQTLIVKDIPGDISEDAIVLDGEGNFQLTGTRLVTQSPSFSGIFSQLDKEFEQIETIDREIEEMEKELALIRKEREMMDENRKIAGEQTLNAATWREATKYYRERLGELQKQEYDILEKHRKKRADRFIVFGKTGQHLLKSHIETRTLHIDIEAPQAGKGKIIVRYMSHRAGWAPSYEVRASFPEPALEWITQAEVWQLTGQDWNNVDLTFTSAEPTSYQNIPEIPAYQLGRTKTRRPWPQLPHGGSTGNFTGTVFQSGSSFPIANVNIDLLNRYGDVIKTYKTNDRGHYSFDSEEPVYNLRFYTWKYQVTTLGATPNPHWQVVNLNLEKHVSKQLDMMNTFDFRKPGIESDFEEMSFRGSRAGSSPARADDVMMKVSKMKRSNLEIDLDPGAITFMPKGKISLPSSQNIRTIPLRQEKITDVDYVHTAVPRIDRKVYLTVRIPNAHNLGLLPGNARLFLANRQVGKMPITPEDISDTLRISFGEDPMVSAAYLPKFQESSKRWFSKKVTQVVAYELKVNNNRKSTLNMVVRDRLPVSSSTDVTVKVLEISDASYNNTNGELEWKFKLEGGSAVRQVKYEITFPAEE